MKNELLSKSKFKQLLLKYYGIKIDKIEKISPSFSDCYILYGNNKYFAKVFSECCDNLKIEIENELLDILKKENFNVPNIIKTKDGNIYLTWENYYIFLEKYIDGYSCNEVELSENELLETARLLGKMHKVLNNKYDDVNKEKYWKDLNIDDEKKKLNNLLESLNNYSKENNELIIKTIKHKIRMLPKLKKMSETFEDITYLMTHGDYSKRNLLKDEFDNFYIIDFSFAGVYPAALELIRSFFISTDACHNGNLFNYDLFFKYVCAYLEEFPLSIKELRLMPYLFLYQILTSNYRYQEYFETKDIK